MSSGRVEPVREATLGPIELRAAHSEIHQDAHRLFSFTVRSTSSAELLESSVHHLRPIAEASESGAGGFHGVGVTVEAEHMHVGPRVQQHRRVASATDRAVDDHPSGHRQEELHHLPSHHREMRELLHIRLLAVSPEPLSPPIPSSAPRSTGTARDVSPSRLRLKAGGVGANNRAGRGAEDEPGTRAPSSCQESAERRRTGVLRCAVIRGSR